jgi:putative endonuclease
MNAYLYILQCADGSFFTGVTSDLVRRVTSHIEGTNPNNYTFYRRPVKLVYYEKVEDRETAFKREAAIKKWPRAKKVQLINGVSVA